MQAVSHCINRNIFYAKHTTTYTHHHMSVQKVFRPALRPLEFPIRCSAPFVPRTSRRLASTEVAQDLESSSSFSVAAEPGDGASSYDPLAQSRGRKKQLPPSRFAYIVLMSHSSSLTAAQIPISTPKVLPRPSTSTSATTSLRSLISSLPSRPLHPAAS